MSKLSFIFGALLIALGFVGFILAGATPKAFTSLIPAFVGVILVLLGAIGRRSPSANMHAMHVAALLTLLGSFAGLWMGIPNALKYFNGQSEFGLKALTQTGLGGLSLVFLILCIRSFIAARVNRKG